MSTRVSSTFAIITVIINSFCSLIHAQSGGFSVDLIHRDSSSSPFYNPRETPSQRAQNVAGRSIGRVDRFTNMVRVDSYSSLAPSSCMNDDIVAPLMLDSDGEYLMNISLGSPPFSILATADTASDITWTLCQPCGNCYEHDSPGFDPRLSSTYKPVSCSSRTCVSLARERSFCAPEEGDTCQYRLTFGNDTQPSGDLATETLALGNMVFPNTLFGCSHDNLGMFGPKSSGIIGLAEGPASLITQLGPTMGKKFSYCMVPLIEPPNLTATSTMHFGQNAVVSGNNVVSTPLFSSTQLPTFFYLLQLDFVSVGATIIPFTGASSRGILGNIILDMAVPYTVVPTDFLSEFTTAFEALAIGGNKTNDPEGVLSLCYTTGSSLEVPPITMHFKGGADLRLTPVNVLIPVSDTVSCLAFLGNDDISIYGSSVQKDFLVGFDLVDRTVSFKPTDCAMN